MFFYYELVFCLVLFVFRKVASLNNTNDADFFPKLYDLENYDLCRQNGDKYCEVVFKLHPINAQSKAWKFIEENKLNTSKFYRHMLFRGICFSKSMSNDEPLMKSFAVTRTNEALKNISLYSEVEELVCKKSFNGMYFKDYTLCFVVLTFLLITIFATLYENNYRNKYVQKSVENVNKFILTFSLHSNLELLLQPIKNEKYEQLKCVQGVRTYTMMLVIAGHTVINFSSGYISNPEFIEEMAGNFSILFSWGAFIVQNYFLLSGWMLVLHVDKYFRRNKNPSFFFLATTVLKRIIRLWPTLIFCVMIHRSNLVRLYMDGASAILFEWEQESCDKRWWMTLFFLNNFNQPKDICNIASWYIAADTQLYLFCLVTIFLIYKLKLPLKTSLICVLLVTVAIQAVIMYTNNLDLLARIISRNFQAYNTMGKYVPELMLWYFAPTANVQTYLLGVIFGVIFLENEGKNLFESKLMKIVWFLCFFGLPFYTLKLASYYYSPLTSAILGSCLKPMYSFGIAVGILGMVNGTGGYIKRIFEWRFAEILGKFTYSVYLYHMAIVFEVILSAKTLIQVTTIGLISKILENIFKSFLIGFSLTMLIDVPISNLNKLLFERNEDEVVKEKIK